MQLTEQNGEEDYTEAHEEQNEEEDYTEEQEEQNGEEGSQEDAVVVDADSTDGTVLINGNEADEESSTIKGEGGAPSE